MDDEPKRQTRGARDRQQWLTGRRVALREAIREVRHAEARGSLEIVRRALEKLLSESTR